MKTIKFEINNEELSVKSITNQKDGSSLKIWYGTQEEYDSLSSFLPNIIYLVNTHSTENTPPDSPSDPSDDPTVESGEFTLAVWNAGSFWGTYTFKGMTSETTDINTALSNFLQDHSADIFCINEYCNKCRKDTDDLTSEVYFSDYPKQYFSHTQDWKYDDGVGQGNAIMVKPSSFIEDDGDNFNPSIQSKNLLSVKELAYKLEEIYAEENGTQVMSRDDFDTLYDSFGFDTATSKNTISGKTLKINGKNVLVLSYHGGKGGNNNLPMKYYGKLEVWWLRSIFSNYDYIIGGGDMNVNTDDFKVLTGECYYKPISVLQAEYVEQAEKTKKEYVKETFLIGHDKAVIKHKTPKNLYTLAVNANLDNMYITTCGGGILSQCDTIFCKGFEILETDVPNAIKVVTSTLKYNSTWSKDSNKEPAYMLEDGTIVYPTTGELIPQGTIFAKGSGSITNFNTNTTGQYEDGSGKPSSFYFSDHALVRVKVKMID